MNGPSGEYESFSIAYDHFNATLFDGKLPLCLITLQQGKKYYGYFSPKRFKSRYAEDEMVDEIALNPNTFEDRTDKAIMSTLVHEMVHLYQNFIGRKPRKGYHDRSWGLKMKEVGLHPSNTSQPGGKEVGQQMSHYIIEGGAFDISCDQLLGNGFKLEWQVSIQIEKEKVKKKNKIKYSCGKCRQNAWAKPNVKLICGECMEVMNAEEEDD